MSEGRTKGAAERGRGGKRVVIAGRPLELRYTINGLCELEELAGMPIDRLMTRQFSATRLLLWAGLTACQPELSVYDAGELIGESLARGGSLEDIIDLCAEGLREAGLMGQ